MNMSTAQGGALLLKSDLGGIETYERWSQSCDTDTLKSDLGGIETLYCHT